MSIKVERLGSTERMTFETFAEFEIQDEDVAAEICRTMLESGEPYTKGEGEYFVRYTITHLDALRRQIIEAEKSLRSWQDNHGVPAEAQGFLEREV